MSRADHRPPGIRKNTGFTLLELLVAMVIFAVMSVMAYGGLRNVIDNSDASKQSLQRLQAVQRAIRILNRDFSQLRPRPVRDAYGQRQLPLLADNARENRVEFTRGGRVNPANLKRSSLLRVAYRVEDNRLYRLQWPFLDAAPGTEPATVAILENISEMRLRFLDAQGDWHGVWPPLNAQPVSTAGTTGEPAVATGQPSAIELVLNLEDWGEIRRLYVIR